MYSQGCVAQQRKRKRKRKSRKRRKKKCTAADLMEDNVEGRNEIQYIPAPVGVVVNDDLLVRVDELVELASGFDKLDHVGYVCCVE